MKRFNVYTRLLSIALILTFSSRVFCQTEGGDAVAQQFNSQGNDASLVYGLFLPSGINGMSNLMTLWGGRYSFKVSNSGMIESQLLTGSGNAQQYLQASVHYRADIALDDMMASLYAGLDIQDAVTPVYDVNGNAVDSSSAWYLGLHIGGALWWEITSDFYFRTDLQVDYGPGTALLVLLSAVYRWGGTGGGG